MKANLAGSHSNGDCLYRPDLWLSQESLGSIGREAWIWRAKHKLLSANGPLLLNLLRGPFLPESKPGTSTVCVSVLYGVGNETHVPVVALSALP